MNPAAVIAQKRDGKVLSAKEIEEFVQGFTDESIPAYQMSALAMAILLRGMTFDETAALTQSMLDSGAVLSWPDRGRPKGDKHSTGGVGDKISLLLAPMLAVSGVDVPMISGRGLGPTGGTLDKLESIPGFRTDLSLGEFQHQVDEVGCVISGATEQLAPADRKLYALRDVTGTVPSVPLITASILSKKLAAGLDGLVLDVKWGSGAFMQTLPEAETLAEMLVGVGHRLGLSISALLTDMNQPLGRRVGNAVEVEESVRCLQGDGPEDLMQVTLALGAELLTMLGCAADLAAGEQALRASLSSGAALEKWEAMVRAQGGDPAATLRIAPRQAWKAERAGNVTSIDCQAMGQLIIELGGGRRVAGDPIDTSVGLEMLVRTGDRVDVGQPLADLFVHGSQYEMACHRLRQAIVISDEQVPARPLIARRLSPSDVTGTTG